MIAQRDVDMDRVRSLTDAELNEPVYNLIDREQQSYIIDGIHRFKGRYDFGYEGFHLHVCHIRYVPYVTNEQLEASIDIPWGKKDFFNGKLVDVE